jgi:hypothetical protein
LISRCCIPANGLSKEGDAVRRKMLTLFLKEFSFYHSVSSSLIFSTRMGKSVVLMAMSIAMMRKTGRIRRMFVVMMTG